MKKLKATILSISLLTIMANAAIAPAISVISKHFSEIDVIYVKMLITFPAIFIIPISLMSGKLVSKFRKKSLVTFGVIMYLIGGLGAFFLTDFWLVFGSRGVLGIGVGILTPLAVGLIADYYEGVERSKMMGYATSFNNLGGIIATVFAGFLSTIAWNYPFLVYILGFYVLYMIIRFLPRGEVSNAKDHSKLTVKVLLLGLSMAGIMIIFYQIPSHLSIYVFELGFGGGLTTGLLIALVTLGAFVFGLVFHQLKMKLGSMLNFTGMLLLFVGTVIVYLTSSIVVLSVGLLLIGASLGILAPNIFLTATIVTKGDPTFSLGVIASVSFVGQFISPLIIDFITELFNLNSVRDPFLITSVMALIGLVFVFAIRKKIGSDYHVI